MAVVTPAGLVGVDEGVAWDFRHELCNVGYVFGDGGSLEEDDFIEEAAVVDEVSLVRGLMD